MAKEGILKRKRSTAEGTSLSPQVVFGDAQAISRAAMGPEPVILKPFLVMTCCSTVWADETMCFISVSSFAEFVALSFVREGGLELCV
eukprot:1413845-Pyramimonas_sp.AAC.1